MDTEKNKKNKIETFAIWTGDTKMGGKTEKLWDLENSEI